MCGIYAYLGAPTDVGTEILRALRRLEYRGYDSWGIAVGVNGQIAVEKHTGKISDASVSFPASAIGFGHTRWATHGGVTIANAHPHLDCSETLAVIHNGIVENYQQLRALLIGRGHRLRSETDSEVVAHLLEDELAQPDADAASALSGVFDRMTGLNAVIALDVRRLELVATKTTSPLVVGAGPRGFAIASDVVALQDSANRVIYLEDGQLVHLKRGLLSLYDRHTMTPIQPSWMPLSADSGSVELGPYPHFMAKEIAEQPDVLDALVTNGQAAAGELARAIAKSQHTILTGCGTASYAAQTGTYLFSQIASHHVHYIAGSEFRHYRRFLSPESLVIALSQSGETADIIDAMLTARQAGARLAALVNVPQSTLDRMVDLRINLGAGPELCVLATKSYTAKIAALLLTSHALRGTLSVGTELIHRTAAALREMMSEHWRNQLAELATALAAHDHLYVLGRGLSYPTALEAALKIKEASYIHAEGFAGGELKHGVIALIEQGTPCIIFAPNDECRTEMISGAMELRSRGGYIIGIGPEPDPAFDVHLATPDVGEAAPLVNALPAQMLGYFAALARRHDPDRPRNLAKSVTVK